MALKGSQQLKKNALDRLSVCWGETTGIYFMNFGYVLLIFVIWIAIALLTVGITNLYSLKTDGILAVKLVKIIIYTVFLLIVSYIIKIPFNFGKCWYLLQNAKGNSVQASSLFTCYTSSKRFFDTIKIEVILAIKKILFGIPLIFIGLLEIFLWNIIIEKYGAVWYTVSTVFIILTACCLVAVYYIFTLRYRLVPYIYAQNPDRSSKEIIKNGEKMMYGRESYMIEIIMSMVKWFIPCILIFPSIFIIPYMMLVYSGAVNEIIENYSDFHGTIQDKPKVSSSRFKQYS